MTEPISETVTKNRKRGRPPKFEDELSLILAINSGQRTRRGQQNFIYGVMAIGALKGDSRFDWLGVNDKSNDPKLRLKILQEIGRLEDEDWMREVASQICEMKPKTADACVLIRRCRTEPRQTFNALRLSVSVAETICTYFNSHQARLTPDILDNILANVRGFLIEDDDDDHDEDHHGSYPQ